MMYVPSVSGMTTSGPVVSLITPTSSSTRVRRWSGAARLLLRYRRGPAPAPDLKPNRDKRQDADLCVGVFGIATRLDRACAAPPAGHSMLPGSRSRPAL